MPTRVIETHLGGTIPENVVDLRLHPAARVDWPLDTTETAKKKRHGYHGTTTKLVQKLRRYVVANYGASDGGKIRKIAKQRDGASTTEWFLSEHA